MSNDVEVNSLMSAGVCVQPSELGDDGWFLPVVIEPPKPKPAKPKPPRESVLAKLIEDVVGPLGDKPEQKKAPAPTEATEDEVPDVPEEPPLPPPRIATATELFRWIKIVLLEKTNLSEDAAELVAIWVISTWFPEALSVHPCLVITGPASEGNRVLHLLKNFCREAVLVAGFSRSHLSVIYGRLTLLISEPNLDKGTATLLSGLTDTNYLVLGAGRLRGLGGPIGIYAGEDPETHDILNSIHIHLTAAKARPSTTSCERLEEMICWIPVHLTQYRDKNLNDVECYTWNLTADVPSEMAAVTEELGRCITEGVELYRKLVDLLKIQHHEHISDRSSTAEAAVLEASLNLGHQGKEQMLVAEIAAELNRMVKERGERLIYSAEKIGHQLKKLGLSTRRLGKAGKGLIMDKATIALLHELAGTYGGAGLTPDDDNLHCPLCTESK